VDASFAAAHQLAPGDRITAILNGRRQELRVVGIALSPEYVTPVRQGEVLPDDRHFGVMWVSEHAVEAAFNMDGAFNDVVLGLGPDGSETAVIAALDRLLRPYGGVAAIGRSEQASHRVVSDELEELRAEALFIPAIFLAVAIFLLNVVVGRLVQTEQTQIATLKALGYDERAIVAHYLELVAALVIGGIAGGIAFGAVLGHAWAGMYTRFFRFPFAQYRLALWNPVVAAIATATAAMLGALRSVLRAARVPPATAMQPPAPPTYRRLRFDESWLGRRLSGRTRMIARSVMRRPGRAALTSFGIAGATAIVLVGSFWWDAMHYILDVQFRQVQREDISVGFNHAVPERALGELRHLPGVIRVEGMRAASAVLSSGLRRRRVELLGLPRTADLHPLLTVGRGRVELPPGGVVLSERLATRLGVATGERVAVELLEGPRPRRDVAIVSVVDELIGMSAYMDRAALNQLMDEGPSVTAALVQIDPSQERALYRALKDRPAVAGVTIKRALKQTFEQLMGRIMLVFSGLLTLFASVIVFGVVYNSARILLAERAWELASLRVLGFTRREISELLLGELAVQLVAGIPIGLAFGYALGFLSVHVMGPETMNIPLVITARTYLFTVATVVAAGAASAVLARRRVDRLDLVAVLKTRE
jgi:putative ABC transport system permease protein